MILLQVGQVIVLSSCEYNGSRQSLQNMCRQGRSLGSVKFLEQHLQEREVAIAVLQERRLVNRIHGVVAFM